MAAKLFISAADRNKTPILEVLKTLLPEKFGNSMVSTLEIASGTGQHAVYFAKEIPNVLWQPSDIDTRYLESIKAYINESRLTNVKQPLQIDISIDPLNWHQDCDPSYKMMVAINLIHITPWNCSEGLFKTAGRCLEPNGILVTYGPYAVNGEIFPESNVRFHGGLKAENPAWGLRDIKDLEIEAGKNGMTLDCMFDMPSNNKTLVWLKE